MDEFLEVALIPEDAGEYAEGLGKILNRIPPRWGRWISCDKGWYPLIIELDQRLEEVFPDYELHQVKEKFGTLRYYIGFPDLQAQCCIDVDAKRPVDGAVNPRWIEEGSRTIQEQYDLDKWFYETLLKHYDTPEHKEGENFLEPEREKIRKLSEKMHAIIDDYEEKSAITCELCGSPGIMKSRHYWYKTLCDSCAEKEGYEDPPIEDQG